MTDPDVYCVTCSKCSLQRRVEGFEKVAEIIDEHEGEQSGHIVELTLVDSASGDED